jgi:uncharacterized Tic20 family protein
MTCELRDDALTIGGALVPLANLASAALVADMSVPVSSGMPPAPAVALRLLDGSSYVLTPTQQSDAARLLQGVHTGRPDLAPPPQPTYGAQPGPFSGTSYATGPGYPPQSSAYIPGPGYPPPYAAPAYLGYPGYPGFPPLPSSAPDSDRGLAVLAHLSGFFLPAILPLILWLALRTSHPYASKQAKQAFVFQLCLWGVGIILISVSYGYLMYTVFSFVSSIPINPTTPPTTPQFPIGWFIGILAIDGIAFLLSTTNLIASVIASMQVAQGKPFHYPLLGRL